jgi:hypothetical protein
MSNATGRPALPQWSQLSHAHSTRERRQPDRTVKVSLGGFGKTGAGRFVRAICGDILEAKAAVDIFDSVLPRRS